MSQHTRLNKVQKKQSSFERALEDSGNASKIIQAGGKVESTLGSVLKETSDIGKEVFVVGARFEVDKRNVFKTYELALEALEGKRKECIINGGSWVPEIKDGQFTFDTGGWDSTTVTWKIYSVPVHDNVKASGFVYDAVAEKLKREAEQKRRELETQKRKEAFINTLTPEQKRELGILFIGDDDDR